jgi:hypothetical protein
LVGGNKHRPELAYVESDREPQRIGCSGFHDAVLSLCLA